MMRRLVPILGRRAGPIVCRRRVLRLVAAGAAAAVAPAALVRGALAETAHVRWRGVALGAAASLTVRTADAARGRAALLDCVEEIRRLERVFALHHRDSALATLNARGALVAPPPALVEVLRAAVRMSEISGGAFDVTVQPLWAVHVTAARAGRDDPEALAAARERVDWRRLAITADRVTFTGAGMAATLNGIAQGYVTDRIVARLAAHGFAHVLADIGEVRARGERAAGAAWRVGVARPDGGPAMTTLRLTDRAVATSSPLATPIGGDGRHHLFDPKSGWPARSWASVSVIADAAMRADALSTAIAVAPEAAAEAILRAGGGEAAILVDAAGRTTRLAG